MDVVLDNLQWLICHKTQPNQIKQSSRLRHMIRGASRLTNVSCFSPPVYVYELIYLNQHVFVLSSFPLKTSPHFNVLAYLYLSVIIMNILIFTQPLRSGRI